MSQKRLKLMVHPSQIRDTLTGFGRTNRAAQSRRRANGQGIWDLRMRPTAHAVWFPQC
jgi:hypothetical protein